VKNSKESAQNPNTLKTQTTKATASQILLQAGSAAERRSSASPQPGRLLGPPPSCYHKHVSLPG